MSNLYPFTTRKQIQARLVADVSFQNEVMVLLYNGQTYREKCIDTTIVKNRVGFMSSHSVRGSKIAKKLVGGETLTDEDRAQVALIAPRYSRQVACYMRFEAIRANPELAATAALFSADNIPMPTTAKVAPVETATEETATEETATEEAPLEEELGDDALSMEETESV